MFVMVHCSQDLKTVQVIGEFGDRVDVAGGGVLFIVQRHIRWEQ